MGPDRVRMASDHVRMAWDHVRMRSDHLRTEFVDPARGYEAKESDVHEVDDTKIAQRFIAGESSLR
jgi:hypothetical protein